MIGASQLVEEQLIVWHRSVRDRHAAVSARPSGEWRRLVASRLRVAGGEVVAQLGEGVVALFEPSEIGDVVELCRCLSDEGREAGRCVAFALTTGPCDATAEGGPFGEPLDRASELIAGASPPEIVFDAATRAALASLDDRPETTVDASGVVAQLEPPPSRELRSAVPAASAVFDTVTGVAVEEVGHRDVERTFVGEPSPGDEASTAAAMPVEQGLPTPPDPIPIAEFADSDPELFEFLRADEPTASGATPPPVPGKTGDKASNEGPGAAFHESAGCVPLELDLDDGWEEEPTGPLRAANVSMTAETSATERLSETFGEFPDGELGELVEELVGEPTRVATVSLTPYIDEVKRTILAGDLDGCELAIGRLADEAGVDVAALDRLRALSLLAVGELERARACLDTARGHGGNPANSARSSLAEFLLEYRSGELRSAIRAALRSLALARRASDGRGERAALFAVSACFRAMGRPTEAARLDAALSS